MAFKSLVLALALGAAAAFTPATVARKSTVTKWGQPRFLLFFFGARAHSYEYTYKIGSTSATAQGAKENYHVPVSNWFWKNGA